MRSKGGWNDRHEARPTGLRGARHSARSLCLVPATSHMLQCAHSQQSQ